MPLGFFGSLSVLVTIAATVPLLATLGWRPNTPGRVAIALGLGCLGVLLACVTFYWVMQPLSTVAISGGQSAHADLPAFLTQRLILAIAVVAVVQATVALTIRRWLEARALK